MKRPPVVRRRMSSEEREMAKHLSGCSFLPGSAAKRFARDIGDEAAADEPTITERQSAYLRSCVYTFRRQIPRDVVSLAGDVEKQRRDFKSQQEWRDRTVAIEEVIRPMPAPIVAPRNDQLELMS